MKSSQQRRSQMPSAKAIHEYWTLKRGHEAAEWFDQVDPGEPSCYACGWYPMSKGSDFRGFERGHIIDHSQGGSPDASNLVLLCPSCNATMPVFKPGQEMDAIAWMRCQPSWTIVGMAKAKAVFGYINEHGDFPPWLRRDLPGQDPEVMELLDQSLSEYLAHRAGETGELFPLSA